MAEGSHSSPTLRDLMTTRVVAVSPDDPVAAAAAAADAVRIARAASKARVIHFSILIIRAGACAPCANGRQAAGASASAQSGR